MRTGDPAGGLVVLEEAIQSEPNHPILLAATAECARMVGNKIKYNRNAKRAEMFGVNASWHSSL
jgi:hypothetical protein